MTNPEQLQNQAQAFAEQGQAATTNLVHTLAENWASAMRTAGGVGSSAATSQSTPAEVIDRSFDLSMQMLEAQRAFAHQLLAAGAPVAQAMEQATDSVAEKAQKTGKGGGARTDAGPGPGKATRS